MLGVQQPRQCLVRQKGIRQGHRRLQQGDRIDPKFALAYSAAAMPGTKRRSTTKPSPTTTRRSNSTPSTPRPKPAATPGTRRRSTTKRSPTTTRRSNSTPSRLGVYNRGTPGPHGSDKAIADLTRRSNSTPRRLAYTIAACMGAKEEYDKAIADFDKAIELDPKIRLGIQQPRPRLVLTRGSTTRRSPTTTRRSNSTPRPPRLRQPRQRLANAKKEYDKAIADYDKAIELDPKLRHGVQRPRQRLVRQEGV